MEKEKEKEESESTGTIIRRHGKTSCSRCNKAGSDVTGPIYFLLREQAKSQVAIRDIQEKLKLVESQQEDMVLAIHGIQNHLVCLKDQLNEFPSTEEQFVRDDEKLKSCESHYCGVSNHPASLKSQLASNNSNVRTHKKSAASTKWNNLTSATTDVPLTSVSKTNRVSCISKQNGKSNMTVDTVIVDTDNKQDSGLESDCRDQGHDSTYTLTDSVRYIDNPHGIESNFMNSKDELSLLLDLINQRGQFLQQEVAELKKQKIMSDETPTSESNQEIKKLHDNNVQLQHQLTAVEEERENLRIQLSHLETASQEMENERKRLQDRLEAAMSEKQQLEFKIHGLHLQFVKATGTKQENQTTESICNNGANIYDLSQKKTGKIILNNEGNRNKVSSILKENNVLELQRQLLTYTVENEVLQTKLEQALQIYRNKAAQWEKSEAALKSHIKQLIQEKELLQKKLEESRVDFATIQANSKILERALNAVSYNTENRKPPVLKKLTQNGRIEPINISHLQESNISLLKDSHVLQDLSDRTQSLPAILVNQKGSTLGTHTHNCRCNNALSEYIRSKSTLNYHNRPSSVVDETKQQLINFNENCESTENTLHSKCYQQRSRCREKHSNFYFTPISARELNSASDPPSLIDSPIENQIWSDTAMQREIEILSGPPSVNHGPDIHSSNDWDHATLIDIQSPVKNSKYSYFKDQTDINSIRSEFDPLSVINSTASRTESQHEIVDSLNLYVSTGQKQLSSTGDSLQSTSFEQGIPSKFIPQIRKFSEPGDCYAGSAVGRYQQQQYIKRNPCAGQLEKTWAIPASHPDLTRNLAASYDMDNNQHFHSILGFMSTTEGETLL